MKGDINKYMFISYPIPFTTYDRDTAFTSNA